MKVQLHAFCDSCQVKGRRDRRRRKAVTNKGLSLCLGTQTCWWVWWMGNTHTKCRDLSILMPGTNCLIRVGNHRGSARLIHCSLLSPRLHHSFHSNQENPTGLPLISHYNCILSQGSSCSVMSPYGSPWFSAVLYSPKPLRISGCRTWLVIYSGKGIHLH